MELARVSLEDKYTLQSGRIYLTGIQALVRLPMMQRARDRAAGLNTAGFISGYRGSPLGGYDSALWQAKALPRGRTTSASSPALNEDLAATAVWGSQQVGLFPGAKVDGVFGIWYGKGPGVDRSLRRAASHANCGRHRAAWRRAGHRRRRSRRAIVHHRRISASRRSSRGDDADPQSGDGAGISRFRPATASRCRAFPAAGWLQGGRRSGRQLGLGLRRSAARRRSSMPSDFAHAAGRPATSAGPTRLARSRSAACTARSCAAVQAFARANQLDRVVHRRAAAAARHRHHRQGLSRCAPGARRARHRRSARRRRSASASTRSRWPGRWSRRASRRFAARPQGDSGRRGEARLHRGPARKLLYNVAADAPAAHRRQDRRDRRDRSCRATGELTPTMVARAHRRALAAARRRARRCDERLARLEAFERPARRRSPRSQRTPLFLLGLPAQHLDARARRQPRHGRHRLPLAWRMCMPDRRHRDLHPHGRRRRDWIGQAPFTGERHVFQNLGDGTYAHSGLLAIRAAAAAGVNITYKILYNDAVAMTGGQPVDGALDRAADRPAGAGRRRRAASSSSPTSPTNIRSMPASPAGVAIRHRDDLDAVQRELRDIAGLTVLIYDQTCAAEKRRRRKRGKFPDPPKRVFINDAVCEGCGDCSDKSNCVSVQPVETEFGRKRAHRPVELQQGFLLPQGLLPELRHRARRPRRASSRGARGERRMFADLPEPTRAAARSEPYGILVTGIGGTGVITVGALLGMAAHLEGKGCTVLDISGLAQKNGAVMSHVRLAPTPEDLHAVRIAPAAPICCSAATSVVAASPAALSRIEARRHQGDRSTATRSRPRPSSCKPRHRFRDRARCAHAISAAAGDGDSRFLDATGLATALMGDSIATNLFMLGYAVPEGPVAARPRRHRARHRAQRRRGRGQQAQLRLGPPRRASTAPRSRRWRPAHCATMQRPSRRGSTRWSSAAPQFLTEYQNAAYAQRYRELVRTVSHRRGKARPRPCRAGRGGGARPLQADGLQGRVRGGAALHRRRLFSKNSQRQFEGDYTLEFHLAPPLLPRAIRQPASCKKRAYGPWMLRAFKLLTWLRPLRGTALDMFGRTRGRRMERRLIAEYEAILRELSTSSVPTITRSPSRSQRCRRRCAASATSRSATSKAPRPAKPSC